MKSILAGFLVAALTIPFAPPAKAAEANWKTTEYWTIVGDYAGYCRAQTDFPTAGTSMSISVTKEGWSLYFGNAEAIPMIVGQPYTVKVSTETARGTLIGKAIDAKIIVFPGLTLETVLIFAKAKSITVGNFGTYNLKGSAEAIKETFSCFQAMTDVGASAPAPTPTTPDREA